MDLQRRLQLDIYTLFWGNKRKMYWNFGDMIIEIVYCSVTWQASPDPSSAIKFRNGLSRISLTPLLPLYRYVLIKWSKFSAFLPSKTDISASVPYMYLNLLSYSLIFRFQL